MHQNFVTSWVQRKGSKPHPRTLNMYFAASCTPDLWTFVFTDLETPLSVAQLLLMDNCSRVLVGLIITA